MEGRTKVQKIEPEIRVFWVGGVPRYDEVAGIESRHSASGMVFITLRTLHTTQNACWLLLCACAAVCLLAYCSAGGI